MCKINAQIAQSERVRIFMKKSTMNNRQSYDFMITINNPLEKGYSHDEIKRIVINNFKTIEYIAILDEIGLEEKTLHTHVYLSFSSRVRWSTIHKHFEGAHIDIVKGMPSQVIAYLRKEGKHSDKSETTIEGTFEEWGHRPKDTKGKRNDMAELYKLVTEGLSNSEILAINQDYILNIDKLDKLRMTILSDKYRDMFRTDLKVIYISGPTNVGKSWGIYQAHPPRDVYRVTDYQHPFDGYSLEPVLVFEEFRSCLPLKEMLEYLDRYPVELRARYCNKVAAYTTVYIISNWELERQYQDLQKTDGESWKAFLRRISEVRVYHSRDEITVYNTVNEYFDKDCVFHSPSSDEQNENPFIEGEQLCLQNEDGVLFERL